VNLAGEQISPETQSTQRDIHHQDTKNTKTQKILAQKHKAAKKEKVISADYTVYADFGFGSY